MSSGSPAAPYRRVTSEPSIAPTVRLTLRTGSSSVTGEASISAPSQSWISVLSSASSSPCSCPRIRRARRAAGSRGTSSSGVRSSPAAFQWSTAGAVSSSSACPIASSSDRKPSSASSSRTSSATYSKNVTTNSGLPV